MPLSNPLHLPAVLHFAQQVPHDSVLDVGIGMGTYGFMLRQFLDVQHERVAPGSWQVKIDGVEVFEPYRNPVWGYAYDTVHMGDARSVLPGLPTYDLAICCDMLEHLTLVDAKTVISVMLEHANVLIATTPNDMFAQGDWGGNEAERHRSHLTAAAFPSLVAAVRTGATTCFVCTRNDALATQVRTAASTCPLYTTSLIDLLKSKVARRFARSSARASARTHA